MLGKMLGKLTELFGNHVAGEAILNSLKGAVSTLLGSKNPAHGSAGIEILTRGVGGLFSSKDEQEMDALLSLNFSPEDQEVFWEIVDRMSTSTYPIIRWYVRNSVFQHFLTRTTVRVKGNVRREEVVRDGDLKIPIKKIEDMEVLKTVRDERAELIRKWVNSARDKGTDAFVTEVEKRRLVMTARRAEKQLRRIPLGEALASLSGATQRAKKEGKDALKKVDRAMTALSIIGVFLLLTGTGLISASIALALIAGITLIVGAMHLHRTDKPSAKAEEEEKK